MSVELGDAVLYTDSHLVITTAFVLNVQPAGRVSLVVFPACGPNIYRYGIEEADTPGTSASTWSKTPAARRIEALDARMKHIERLAANPMQVIAGKIPADALELTDYMSRSNKLVMPMQLRSVERLPDDVVKQLDPGIRNLVVYLRALGFETTDSGDGYSKPADERVFHTPHVAMRCEPWRIVEASDHLLLAVRQFVENLKNRGDDLQTADDWRLTVGDWHIETSYCPNDKSCVMLAMYDSMYDVI